jgi:hypothetical protein
MIHLTPIRVAVVTLVAACVGCPGSLEDPSRFSDAAGSCPDVPTAVFQTTCSSTSGCHSATDKQLGLDLQSPGVAARLIGVHPMGGPGLLIDPSNPAVSVVYTKLTATPPFGARMPFGQTPLDDATIACVLQWITVQVTDGGAGDDSSASEASTDDGPASDDSSSPPPDDATTPGDDATTPPPPPPDAGSGKPDARAPMKDASTGGGMDAAPIREASAPPVDATAE